MFVTQSFLEENVPSDLKKAISSGNTGKLFMEKFNELKF